MLPYCLDFESKDADSLPISGGKGCNLAKLKQAGFDIPPGFIITTSAFTEFLRHNHLEEIIAKELDSIPTIDPVQIQKASKRILEKFDNAKIPPMIIEVVRLMLISTTYDCVAVRSSATAEDLPFASFAGQQESFLNISDEAEIFSKLILCWASLYNERSITYRLQNRIDHHVVKMAVVIQKMIPAEISGILFTADPISNHHRHLVINAGFGLGEGLVMGLVNPDQIVVDKSNKQVLSIQISDKRHMIKPLSNGGTIKEEVEQEFINQPALSLDQIEQLTNLGIQVEDIYKQPQDIEWAIADQRLYLLQSRPITSLFPIPFPPPKDQHVHVYFSVGHVQMITEPISPFGISILQLFLPFGRDPHKVDYAPYIQQAAGRLYADITPILTTSRGKRYFPRAMRFAEPVSGLQVEHLLQREEFRENNDKTLKVKPKIIIEWIIPLVLRTVGWLFFRKLSGTSQRTIGNGQEFIDILSERFSNTPVEKKLDAIKESMSDLFHERLIWMMGMVAAGQLSRLMIERILKSRNIQLNIQALQSGLEGNVTTEMDLLVGDLADIVAKEPDLVKILEVIVDDRLMYTPDVFDEYPLFNKTWKSFLEKYGMRGVGELDISRPRWQDEPQTLFQTMLARAKSSQHNSHRDHYQKLKNKNLAIQEEIIKSLQASFRGRMMLPLVRRLLNVTTTLIPIREHPKYLIMKYFQLLRREIGLIREYLIEKGLLNTEDDIWFLRFDELQAAFSNPSLDYSKIIQERKTLYDHYWKLTPPRVITSDGEIPRVALSREGLPHDAIVGNAVSAGCVEGIARVIMDPSQEQLQPGEILVAPYTDPGWTPLFINAAGIVLETGGLMTHGSVVAREYGIPAVVGVVDATQIIKTGMQLRVNGDHGYVEII